MLYELTIFGTYYQQATINRFNYLSSGTAASVLGSFGLMHAFGAIDFTILDWDESPLARILNIQTSDAVINNIVVRAASDYDVEDFYERPFLTPLQGATTPPGMSPTAVMGFRTNRVRLDIDRGTKRFSGMSESFVDGGGVLTSAAQTALGLTATAMSNILTYDDEGSTLTFSPCIVSKQPYETESGRTAYQYYPTLAEQLTHLAVGIQWQPYSTQRTQRSRQYE